MWKPCSSQRKDDAMIHKIETKIDNNEENQNTKMETMKGKLLNFIKGLTVSDADKVNSVMRTMTEENDNFKEQHTNESERNSD